MANDETEDEDVSDDDAVADADGEEESGDDDDDESGGKKKLLIIIAPLVLLCAVGAGLYFTGMLDKMLGKGGEDAAQEEQAKQEGAGDGQAVFYEIPDLIVNLSSTTSQPRYLKLRVQLELRSQEDLQVVEKAAPRIIDHFQTYLRELRIQDLRGSAGIYRLRLELLSRVNAAAYPAQVKDVLFQEILIQ